MKKLFFGSIENANSADLVLALLRIFIGLSLMLVHGSDKIPVSDGFIEHIGSLGFPIPAIFAWAAALSEYLGALLLALGLFTRPAALMVAFTMFVAAVVNHGTDPFAVAEKAYLYLSISLLFVVLGSGKYGADAIIRRKLNI
ncbi:MAG: DoxX family protein [Cyclobacteriaceae bacterium]|nr:DoxX family protein [Cyclobacteriaceae bacterium]